MKRDSQYRFNIQFTACSDDETRVGEFLNSLGRRKSTVIVAAVIEYLQHHPELLGDDDRIQVSTVSADQLEATIRAIIDEKLSTLPVGHKSSAIPASAAAPVDADIVDMLSDLELFTNF